MTNPDSILKSRDIALPTKVHLVKGMVSPVVMYGCESWTIKKAESQRISAFELWCWRRLLRVPWTAWKSNQSILKEISPNIHWKDWCWSWNSNTLATWCEESSSVQSFSHVWLFRTPWTSARQVSLSITNYRILFKLMSVELVLPSNHLILCWLLLLLPSVFPSTKFFSSESALHISWPKYWSCSFSISPSSEYSRLISFRIDWFDLLVVQGTLKSLLQHHSLKASVFWCSAFFMVQLSHLYMTTENNYVLTIWTFVSKVMPLIQGTWIWANSGSWWGTGKPGMLQSMGSQWVAHYLVT